MPPLPQFVPPGSYLLQRSIFKGKKEKKEKWEKCLFLFFSRAARTWGFMALSLLLRVNVSTFLSSDSQSSNGVKSRERSHCLCPLRWPLAHPAPPKATPHAWDPGPLYGRAPSPWICTRWEYLRRWPPSCPVSHKFHFFFHENNSVLNHRRLKLEKYEAHIIIKLF